MSRVLLISWDAADWRLVRPLMEQGQMPHLQKMVAGGVSGDLGMTLPRLASSRWTSAITGKRAHKHRVLSSATDSGLMGDGGPERRCSALWNILEKSQRSSLVVGWPVTDPAESIRGVMVSDRFIRRAVRDPIRLHGSGLNPTRLLERVPDLVVSSDRLAPEVLKSLVPRDFDPSSKLEPVLEFLRTGAAELSTVQAAATALAQWEPWDFLAVHYPGIQFLDPIMSESGLSPGFPDVDGSSLVSGSLTCLDRMLGTLVHLVGPETRILLVAGGLGRPDPFGSIPALGGLPSISTSTRDRGLFAMTGPGIRSGASVVGASILDVTPTVLQAFGLPVGNDMDGVVLPVFEEPPHVSYVPSWDLPAEDSSVQDRRPGMSGSEPRIPERVPATISPDERYHLACDLMECRRLSEAARELEVSWSDPSSDLHSGLLLMRCRLLLGQNLQARKSFDELLVRLRDAETGEVAPCPPGSVKMRLDQSALWYLEAELLEREGRLDAAMRVYRQMLRTSPPRLRRDFHLRLAEGFLRSGERSAAIQNFVTACSIDATHVPSFVGLSRAYLLARRFQDAVAEARRSIEMDPANPSAHFLHGVALTRCGHPDWAVESLEEAVRQSPSLTQAHRRLARIYERDLNDPVKARHYLQLFLKARGVAVAPSPRRRSKSTGPASPRPGRAQGRMAKARTGKPSPPSGLGQATTISDPVAGT